MRNFNGSYLYESCGPGVRGSKIKNRCLSSECKCSPPVVNIHHHQCPLTKTPCPLHGYPFIYSLKNKKTRPDEYLVICFHPSLKTDKLFEPVKTFLTQACEPDTKIKPQYYSPRLSDTNCEDFKDFQIQTNPEDFKKLLNSCFVEKKKTFLSEKTNKMKRLKQCFNSPCSSVVHKSRSCTAIKEKIDRIFREGIGDGYPDKSKLEKKLKAGCCMKSEESSHFLYKRDFDLSDGEKSSKERIDLDFVTKINNNLFEIRSRKGFNEIVSTNINPYFLYPSFVATDPIGDKVQGQAQTEEVSDLEKTHKESQKPEKLRKDKKPSKDSPHDSRTENVLSDSSGSVFFTPFVFVPTGKDKEVEHKALQTINQEPEMSNQWVQTKPEEFPVGVSEILVTDTNYTTTETQTSGQFMPEACICRGPQTISDEGREEKPVETTVVYYEPEMKFLKREEKPESEGKNLPKGIERVSVATQTGEMPVTSTVLYYEPEMKFLKREEKPESEGKNLPKGIERVSVATQTEEIPAISTVLFYEPKMKFLKREEKPESEEKHLPKAMEMQDEEKPIMSTVVYHEPEMKFLRRKERPESENKNLPKSIEPVSVATQTEEIPAISTVLFYEPKMKFLKREEKPESEEKHLPKAMEPMSVEMQGEEKRIMSTVVYHEPEMGFLRRKERPESENKNLPKSIEPVSVATQTEEIPAISTVLFYEMKFLKREEKLESKEKHLPKAMEPMSVEMQDEDKPIMSTVVYYEPEMKFQRKEKASENEKKGVKAVGTRSLGIQTEDKDDSRSKAVEGKVTRSASTLIPSEHKLKSAGVQTEEIPTIIYFEPEMKFLTRTKSSESFRGVKKLKSIGVQTQSEPVTVIYFEPEMKFLRRKDDTGKRSVLFNEQTQINEGRGREDKSVGTESEPLDDSEREKYHSAYLPMSQNKKTQTISDSDSSLLSYFDGSDTSNQTYVLKSYVSEETEQIVVKNWNKSRSDGDMLEKKKYEGADTNPNGMTFVGVYHKKETHASSNPTKAKLPKPEAIAKRNEDNNASFADLSDLIRIIDENFKKMFDRGMGVCECQKTKERKPTVDKEMMTDISGADDAKVILKLTTRSMANAQIQAGPPLSEDMILMQSDSYQKPRTCKVCSKVISMTTVSVGTNTLHGSFFKKIKEVDIGTFCKDFPIGSNQEAPVSKPKPTETPSGSKGMTGEVKSVRMSSKTFVTKLEEPPESKPLESKSPRESKVPTPQKPITYPEPFSDSTTSLRRDLRRAQKELDAKSKQSPRQTSSIRSRPTPAPTPTPRPTQSPQSRPQVYTRVIQDSYCGNIIATTTTRQIPSGPIQERCPFDPPTNHCVNASCVCPPPPRPPNSGSGSPRKDPSTKRNHSAYHVTISPLWSKDIMNMFESKLKKILKGESFESVSDSRGKQKRNHDGGSDGGPTGKKMKSPELDKINNFDTNLLEQHGCLELGKSQTDIIFKWMKGENELVLNESPRLAKDTGFVWIPSFPTPQFFSIKKVSSAEETAKSKETPKEVNRSHSYVLPKKPKDNDCTNLPTKNTCHQNSGEKTFIKKLFKCSSCKSVTYLQLKNSEITENPKNNSKPNLEDYLRSLEFTPRSHSLVETATLNRISENSFPRDEKISLINSQRSHFYTVSSTETNVPSSGSDQTQKILDDLYSKFPSEKSNSNFEIDSNEVETCNNLELATSNHRSNKFLFRESSTDVSNSKMTTKSECFRTYWFCADSSAAISLSKKKILKKFPSLQSISRF